MLIGFEFTRVDYREKVKVFVPLDKILYVEELYERDLITGERTEEVREGARVHLVTKENMLVEEDYQNILERWMTGTNEPVEPDIFDLSA